MTHLCFVDVETTGLDPSKHEIIELAAISVDPATWKVRQELEVKIAPEHIGTADDEALRISGYTPDNWTAAISLAEAMDRLRLLLNGAIPAGHNVRFDLGFLEAAWKTTESPDFTRRPKNMSHRTLDTASLAMPLYLGGIIRSLKLEDVARWAGVVNLDRHRAMPDARTSMAVARTLIEKMIVVHPSSDHARREMPPAADRKAVEVLYWKGTIHTANLERICQFQLGEHWARFTDEEGTEYAFPREQVISITSTPHRNGP